MLQQKEPDHYLISTGKTHSIKDFLREAFAHVGITEWEQYIKLDPQFSRPSDLRVLKSDSSQSKKKLGWKPKINFTALVRIMVDADIKRLTPK